MIIYGSNATNIGEFTLPQAECAHCKERAPQHVSVFGRYAHIFWIPFFPIGTVKVAECNHCKRTLKKKEWSDELRRKYDEQTGEVSRPVWHYAGLAVVLLFFGSSFLVSALRTPDPREALLDADLATLTAQPDIERDSVSFYLKDYLDQIVVPELEPENFKYLTQETPDKVLILLQVPKITQLDRDVRPEMIDMIEEMADEFPHLDRKARYIAIEGRSSIELSRAPQGTDLEDFYEYYGPKENK